MVVPVFVIAGVSGCGKSTISESISQKHSFSFIEGDSLHPQSNIDKMSHGTALTDEDRWSWLDDVKKKSIQMAKEQEQGSNAMPGVVITCSSLKRKYRDVLAQANKEHIVELFFIFLNVKKEELIRRMETRKGHYMKRDMLESQLRDLEMPTENKERCYVVDADQSIEQTTADVSLIVEKVLEKVNSGDE